MVIPGGRPSRRRLLKLGLFGGAAVAAGGALLRWLRFGYSTRLAPTDVPIAFDVKELAIAKAAVEALLPAADGLPSGVSLGIHQQVDEQLFGASEALRGDFKNGLQLLEHATVASGYGSRFTALEPHQRAAYLAALMNGSNAALRQIAFGLKEVIHLRYYGHPAVWGAIGYDGPLVPRASPPAQALAYRQRLKERG